MQKYSSEPRALLQAVMVLHHVVSPDRWLTDSAKRAADVPGVYSSLMTFIGGPRTCVSKELR